MVFASFLALSTLFASALGSTDVGRPSPPSDLEACKTIASRISKSSGVFYPGSPDYANDTYKWAPNSAQQAVCAVEPGNAQDVATIVELLGSTFTATKFGVKGGGHSCNAGFSSSSGVLIAMRRMDEVKYNKAAGTVDIGPGNIWDNVYGELDAHNVTVLGGRISGVGAAGLLLGGGYSWFSSRYGVSLDSVVAYEVVLPSGQIVDVTATKYPDIFFGLKGGFLNFGIVTKFTMTAIPLGPVWGGLINFNETYIPAALDAMVTFANNNTDIDAEIVFAYIGTNGTTSISMLIFYNGPAPGPTLEPFLQIPAASEAIGQMSFLELFKTVAAPYYNTARQRTIIGSPRIHTFTNDIMNEVKSQIALYTSGAKKVSSDYTLSIALEPFVPSGIVREDITATAWPHSEFVSPLAILASWDNESEDEPATAAEQAFRTAIEQTAAAEGQPSVDTLFPYPNYSTADIPNTQMYGPNLARLQSIAAKYDPHKLFARAGGIRFQTA